jgi:hypothetical protein
MNAPKRISNKKQNDLQNGEHKISKNEKSGVKVNGLSNTSDSSNHQVLIKKLKLKLVIFNMLD